MKKSALRTLLIAGIAVSLMACGSSDDDTDTTGTSSTTDTSSTDTGSTDTGSTDTGSTDTGSTDTSSTDTGSTDTGSTDTGSTDTGSTDTGSTDTGSTDTGTNDDRDDAYNPAEHPNVGCEDIPGGDMLCEVTGQITTDLTLKNEPGILWGIAGPVFVGNDTDETILTIEPGVTVFANTTTDDTLLCVRRGAKLIADGTANAPIVFTPSANEGERQRGMWGGLIINGRAHLNKEGGVAEGEGNTGEYGGGVNPINDDNSGILRYVRVEFAGKLITTEDELNGIAFQAVGSGTIVDYVQVHMNQDDGIEFFGGTVNAKHLVLTGIGDDSIDWTSGYTGNIQYAVVHQYADNADRGIEADNDKNNNDIEPRSNPTIANLSIVGCGEDCNEGVGSQGILLRRGTGLNLYNSIVTKAADACLDIDDAGTMLNAWDDVANTFSGEAAIIGSIINGCNGGNFSTDDDAEAWPFTLAEWFGNTEWNNKDVDPMLNGYVPANGSPALSAGVAIDHAFFEAAGFIGAIGSDDWTAGWTTAAQN